MDKEVSNNEGYIAKISWVSIVSNEGNPLAITRDQNPTGMKNVLSVQKLKQTFKN